MNKIIAKVMASYLSNEEGLVTIEWVGIAAVVVVAGILISSYIMGAADNLSGDINTSLSNVGGTVQTATIPTFGTGGAPAAP